MSQYPRRVGKLRRAVFIRDLIARICHYDTVIQQSRLMLRKADKPQRVFSRATIATYRAKLRYLINRGVDVEELHTTYSDCTFRYMKRAVNMGIIGNGECAPMDPIRPPGVAVLATVLK